MNELVAIAFRSSQAVRAGLIQPLLENTRPLACFLPPIVPSSFLFPFLSTVIEAMKNNYLRPLMALRIHQRYASFTPKCFFFFIRFCISFGPDLFLGPTTEVRFPDFHWMINLVSWLIWLSLCDRPCMGPPKSRFFLAAPPSSLVCLSFLILPAFTAATVTVEPPCHGLPYRRLLFFFPGR